jgi:hypothetical protein
MDARVAALPDATAPARRRAWIAGAIVAVACVLAAVVSWPGFATQDTLFTTSEALRGTYTTYHPLLNALLLRVLAVPFESYAPYTALQILLCGLLFHRALVLVAADSARTWPTVVSALGWALSASTILYLGMIWKDVLTAYSMLYAAALLYHLRTVDPRRIELRDAVLLGIALVLLANLRHGMAINLLVLPALYGPRRLLADRRLGGAFAVAGAVFLALAALGHSPLVRNDEVHLTRLKIAAVSQPMLGIVASPDGYTSDDHSYDGALMYDVFGPEFRDHYKADYFRNEVVLTDKARLEQAYRAIVLRTPRLCLLNLSRCLSGRVEMMFATLQPSADKSGTTFYELGASKDCLATYSMNANYCGILDRFSSSERSALGNALRDGLVARFVHNRGAVQNLLVWNLFPAMAMVLLVLVVYRFDSPQWVVAAYFALQLALPFATSMATDFRYYYFLAPYGFVFLPKLLEAFVGRARARLPAPAGA